MVEQSRSRRDVRPLRLVEIPENMIGDVLDVGSGRRHEFFAFKQPAPRQLSTIDTDIILILTLMMMMSVEYYFSTLIVGLRAMSPNLPVLSIVFGTTY